MAGILHDNSTTSTFGTDFGFGYAPNVRLESTRARSISEFRIQSQSEDRGHASSDSFRLA